MVCQLKFYNTTEKGLFLKETFASPWSKTLPFRVVSISEGIGKTCLIMAFAVRLQNYLSLQDISMYNKTCIRLCGFCWLICILTVHIFPKEFLFSHGTTPIIRVYAVHSQNHWWP